MVDTTPTVAGFTTFIRRVMDIDTAELPDDDPVIEAAFTIALEIVNRALNRASPTIYTLAVYNLSGDNLVNYAQDQDGQTFFADLRKNLNLNGFVGGVIQSTGDEGTNESLVVPEAMKNFTMANLQNLKTPWGRQYLAFARSYGPNVWGIS